MKGIDVVMVKCSKKAIARDFKEFFKPFYIYGRNARYLSSHFFVCGGFIYQRVGVECSENGYKCVDVIKEQR